MPKGRIRIPHPGYHLPPWLMTVIGRRQESTQRGRILNNEPLPHSRRLSCMGQAKMADPCYWPVLTKPDLTCLGRLRAETRPRSE